MSTYHKTGYPICPPHNHFDTSTICDDCERQNAEHAAMEGPQSMPVGGALGHYPKNATEAQYEIDRVQREQADRVSRHEECFRSHHGGTFADDQLWEAHEAFMAALDRCFQNTCGEYLAGLNAIVESAADAALLNQQRAGSATR